MPHARNTTCLMFSSLHHTFSVPMLSGMQSSQRHPPPRASVKHRLRRCDACCLQMFVATCQAGGPRLSFPPRYSRDWRPQDMWFDPAVLDLTTGAAGAIQPITRTQTRGPWLRCNLLPAGTFFCFCCYLRGSTELIIVDIFKPAAWRCDSLSALSELAS